MSADRTLTAVQGYLELNMPGEALRELTMLEEAQLRGEEPMQLLLICFIQLRRWEEAIQLTERMRMEHPELTVGYLHGAFCLHELGRTQEAKEVLLASPSSLALDPTYYYNLGCYDSVLGNIREAMQHLRVCFEMDDSFRGLAKFDPDLENVRSLL